jgi:DNA replication and repair protein RecF
MILKHLSIINYRNLQDVELSFSHKLNCFVGTNGVGKTNLLDAIYYLSFCKSAVNPIDSQNIRHGEEFFIVKGEYVSDVGSNESISCGLKKNKKKSFKRNDKEYSRLSDHIGSLPLVMISPSDDYLISGGSEERRKFLDVVISQYDSSYLNSLIRYNRAMEQRNKLLKNDAPVDDELFDVFEETMAIAGKAVYCKRREFVDSFMPIFQKYYELISLGKEQVQLEYISHAERGPLLETIRNSRSKDLIMGYSLHGIHKDDLIMKLDNFAIKKEGSQGQNKTCLIALKFAQYTFLKNNERETPILLLDDIFDKLDMLRVSQIIKVVAGEDFGQIFITDTNKEHLNRIFQSIQGDYYLFTVKSGEAFLEREDIRNEEK